MLLSDLSVKRPVFATVVNLLLVTFGILAFSQLPLREYPDVNAPIVSISTDYRGASAAIVETKITQVLEELVSGIEGIKSMSSSSSDGGSRINIEFKLTRDIDAAANDVRERIARALDDLPEEADPPEIYKADSNTDVIMWLNLSSPTLSSLELSDYAERYLQDRFATVDGVARVRIGGGGRYAMRIWLNSLALAARQLTITDIEDALRRENVELPAGRIESKDREFTLRVARGYRNADDFAQLVLKQQPDGTLIRLADVARVELGTDEYRKELRGNGEPMVGIGIIKQSTANTLAVSRAVKREAEKVSQQLPEYIKLHDSYDTSVFVEGAIQEVYRTLFITMILVVVVILVFLGSLRATLVPAVTVPISLISAFIALSMLGFSVNLLTLLALVLAIGLVVDDAIVVLENIYRRIELGEPPLTAAYHGARQVSFAVIVTTLVLIAVFVPIAFLQGNVGRLFAEFALTMAAAVSFSSIVALSLSPMMCSKLFKPNARKSLIHRIIDSFFRYLAIIYQKLLEFVLKVSFLIILLLIGIGFGIYYLFQQLPTEFTPKEDRGAFFIMMTAPEGASFSYTQRYMAEIEKTMLRYVENGEAIRALARVPLSFGNSAVVNSGIGIMVLEDWDKRRPAWAMMSEVMGDMKQLVGVKAFTVMRRGLGQRGIEQPVQFVIGGSSYEELVQWRDIILDKARQNQNLISVDADYKETKPQLMLVIDKNRAADLGVSIQEIGRTLETLLGSRRVTTFLHRGEEYDVMLEGEDQDYRTPADLASIYVRAEKTGILVPLSSLITIHETATSTSLERYNRMRAITISANLAEGYTLGEALSFLENIAKNEIPLAQIDYKGQSADFQDSTRSVNFTFILALLVVFLVLAAQFESFIHPLVIMLTVPLAIFGALLGLNVMGLSINIYSQIGIVMLIGLATKNGILIVEFTNQLRDAGQEFKQALLEASQQRLRPILMTAITTIMGALPLILAHGAGSESRIVIGVVIFSGVTFATVFTLFVVPVAYWLLAKHTTSPNEIARQLETLARNN